MHTKLFTLLWFIKLCETRICLINWICCMFKNISQVGAGIISATLKSWKQGKQIAALLSNRFHRFSTFDQTGALLNALVQLCHISTPLAERTWVQLFPRLWKILSDRQQHVSLIYWHMFHCSHRREVIFLLCFFSSPVIVHAEMPFPLYFTFAFHSWQNKWLFPYSYFKPYLII